MFAQLGILARIFELHAFKAFLLYYSWPFFFILLPINLTCIFERFLATIFYQNYETMRPWYIFLLPACSLICVIALYVKKLDDIWSVLDDLAIYALQIILPYCFWDSMFNLIGLVFLQFLSVDEAFIPATCIQSPIAYTAAFFAVLVFRQVVCLLSPIVTFRINTILRRPVLDLLRKIGVYGKNRIRGIHHRQEFRNVMGRRIALSASQDMYFSQLTAHW
ncbi:unnamed protein product, partial [Mesorhabditis spiculigera]